MKDTVMKEPEEEFPRGDIRPLAFQALNTLGEPDPANITKQDLLSAVAFDRHGQYLSVGDRGGRIIVFSRIEEDRMIDFDYLTEFQSHEPAFDPLNSNQIPEKINAIEWINIYQGSQNQLLTANDKLIKLWRIEYRKEKKYESSKKLLQKGHLMMPRSKVVNENWEGRMKQQYRNGHEYHINSLSVSPDGEGFLSADDLRINLWNIEDNSIVYNLLDIKPKNKDELDEVVTHCEFHPTQPNIFLYSTSLGAINICDLRQSSNFQNKPSLKYEVGLNQKKNAFSDILNTVSSAKFFKRYPDIIASRDYLSLKLWDIRTAYKVPAQQYQVSDYVEKNLLSLYEEDYIYDKFFMDISPCNQYIATGSYNNCGQVIDITGTYNTAVPTNFNVQRGKPQGVTKKFNPNKKITPGDQSSDFKKKVQSGCWSPRENTLALVYRNCIFLFSEKVVK